MISTPKDRALRACLLVALLLAAPLLFSCGGNKVGSAAPIIDTRSPMEREIAALNSAGNSALRDGDYKGAEGYFSKALRLALSIEREESIAINVMSAANALWMQGRLREADGMLDILLEEPGLGYDERHLAQAAYLKAAISAEEGDADDAIWWVEVSKYYSSVDKTPEIPGTRVVNARAFLMKGMPREASEAASFAASKAASAGNRAEQANALRVQADAELALGRPKEAMELFERAIRLDKQLELPRKIAMDLMGQGRALEELANPIGADVMYRRAASVAEAGRAEDLKKEALWLLKVLHRPAAEVIEEPAGLQESGQSESK